MSTREVENVMSPEALTAGIEEMMTMVQAPWRQPLRMLLAEHPTAQKCFAEGHPYEAFEIIKGVVGEMGMFSPFAGQPPMNIPDFLGLRLDGMPLTYQIKDDNYRTA